MDRKDRLRKQNEKLVYTTFLPKEDVSSNPSYDDELLQFEYIRSGDRRSIPESQRVFRSGGAHKLSKDPLRHARYRFIETVSLAAHYAVEGGLTSDQASNIKDLYIQKVDLAASVEGILELLTEFVGEVTDRVSDIRRTGQIALPLYNTDLDEGESDGVLTPAQQSRAISECMEYIYYHLYEKIYLEELADHVKLSPNYLSTLFHVKRGMTIQAYIRSRKIEAASNMLLYSEYTIAQISSILAFSSPSHFIRVFRQETGTTPKVFQEQNYRKHWSP